MSEQSPVFYAEGGDPEMERAYENARATFRYFWREVAWERRRIIPALDVAAVKLPFSDGEAAERDPDAPGVEHMWVSDVDFDGRFVSGTLLNEPRWLKTVHKGDSARVPLGAISDWMYAILGEVYGAYTVNLLRSRMDPEDRQQHDGARGLEFGDPANVRVVPEWKPDTGEHPMSEAMASSLREHLAKDPSFLNSADDRGWTLLHQEALAGSAPTVRILLNAGADTRAVTDQGMTPLDLARSLGWENVVALLTRR